MVEASRFNGSVPSLYIYRPKGSRDVFCILALPARPMREEVDPPGGGANFGAVTILGGKLLFFVFVRSRTGKTIIQVWRSWDGALAIGYHATPCSIVGQAAGFIPSLHARRRWISDATSINGFRGKAAGGGAPWGSPAKTPTS